MLEPLVDLRNVPLPAVIRNHTCAPKPTFIVQPITLTKNFLFFFPLNYMMPPSKDKGEKAWRKYLQWQLSVRKKPFSVIGYVDKGCDLIGQWKKPKAPEENSFPFCSMVGFSFWRFSAEMKFGTSGFSGSINQNSVWFFFSFFFG